MRRAVWALLLAAGYVIALPLGWISYLAIAFAPGFAILSLVKKEMTIAELAGISATLSVLLLPLAILLSSIISIRYAGLFLGGMTIAAGIYHILRSSDLRIRFSRLACTCACRTRFYPCAAGYDEDLRPGG